MPRLVLGIALAATVASAQRAEPRPSFVFVLADDLGHADLACYGNSRGHRTPSLDRLAAQGVRFTNAYANAPNCAPTRACLMSGQYGPRHGVYTVGSAARGRAALRRLVPVDNATALGEEIVTIPEVLGAAGYTCASIGKWHLGDDPRSQGFDRNVAGSSAGHPRSYFSPYRNPSLPDGPGGECLTDRLTDEAIAFLRANRARPFFLYLPYFAVHTPIQAKPELAEEYRRRGLSRRAARYAAMVETLDAGVGRLMSALDELELSRRTVVVFFSDNGGHGAYADMGPLRGAKGMLYEGGIRVPLIVRWPGVIEPGRTESTPVIGTDFFPTLLELARVARPAGKSLDGVSLANLLRGEAELLPRELHWHFPAYLEGTTAAQGPWRTTPAGAIRIGRHKLIEFFETGARELYDLDADPGETEDLAARMPDRVEVLHAALRAWRERVGAPVPTRREPAFDEAALRDWRPRRRR